MQKRFKFPEGSVELYAEKVANRGLCAVAQAESLRYKLLGGLAVRRCVAPHTRTPRVAGVEAAATAVFRQQVWQKQSRPRSRFLGAQYGQKRRECGNNS